MKKMKLLGLLLLTTISATMPVYANEYVDSTYSVDYENAETIDNKTKVYVTQSSEFSVTIPKTIILNGNKNSEKSGLYEVTVTGDIAGDEIINVVPDNTFLMSQSGKDDVTATIQQDKTEWKYNEFSTTAQGKITANDITAGSWEGEFYFDIFRSIETNEVLSATNLPAGIYNDDVILADWDSLDVNLAGYTEATTALTDGTSFFNVLSQYDNIDTVILPYGITAINERTFYNVQQNINVMIPDGVTYIAKNAFNGSGVHTIYVPVTVTKLDAYALSNNVNPLSVQYEGTEEQWSNITGVTSLGNRDVTVTYNVER